MKRYAILLLLFISTLGLYSQVYYCYTPASPADLRHYLKYQQKDRDSILENKIKHVISYDKLYSKKGKLKRSVLDSETFYDDRGDMVGYTQYTNKGKLRYTVKYSYAENGLQTGMKMYGPNGKFIRGWKATLNSAGLVERCDYYRKKEDKLAWGFTCEYNADTLRIKEQHFDHKNRPTVRVERDYFPNKELKETRTYTKKGKLKRMIKYDCSPVGTTDDESKTYSVCEKSSYDADSNRIETRETTRKGKIWRSVWRYNRQNQLVEFTSLNHKGREQYRYIYKYDENGRLSVLTNFRKARFNYMYVYEYAPGGQRIMTRYLDKKSRVWWEQFEVIQ